MLLGSSDYGRGPGKTRTGERETRESLACRPPMEGGAVNLGSGASVGLDVGVRMVSLLFGTSETSQGELTRGRFFRQCGREGRRGQKREGSSVLCRRVSVLSFGRSGSQEGTSISRRHTAIPQMKESLNSHEEERRGK